MNNVYILIIRTFHNISKTITYKFTYFTKSSYTYYFFVMWVMDTVFHFTFTFLTDIYNSTQFSIILIEIIVLICIQFFFREKSKCLIHLLILIYTHIILCFIMLLSSATKTTTTSVCIFKSIDTIHNFWIFNFFYN